MDVLAATGLKSLDGGVVDDAGFTGITGGGGLPSDAGIPSDDLEYTSIVPQPGDTELAEVLPTTAFKVRFDRLLLPETTNRQGICIQPSFTVPQSDADCTDDPIFTRPSYDPVRREITYRLTPGTVLPAGTELRLTVYGTTLSSQAITAFDGAGLVVSEPVDFKVLAPPIGVTYPADIGPQGDHFCSTPDPTCTDVRVCPRSVKSILQACGTSGCHKGNPTDAAEGMDLSSAAGILATAIDITANETQTGESAATFEATSARFGRSLPRIAPVDPGNSYLLYKLLANHFTSLVVPWTPAAAAPDEDAPEVTRLRNAFVVGMPMPPQNEPAAVLRAASAHVPDEGEIEWLSDWIHQGAPLTCSP